MSIQDLTASLDLKQNLNIYATCKQFDSLNLILTIYDNSIQATLTGYAVRLKAMKSDNIPMIQEHTGITISGNVVTIVADEQLTTTSGKTLIELEFINTSTGKKKATFNLVLQVVPSTLEVNANISTATYTLLEELENKLDQATDFLENVDEAIIANNNLVSNIAIANPLNTDLESNIAIGTPLKNSLESNISLGNVLKPELDAKNAQAQSNITAMQGFGDVTQLAQDVTALKTEVINARETEVDLKTRIDKVAESSTGSITLNPSGDTTGTTDNTNIQNAIATGGKVILSKGAFYINNIIIDKNNTNIEGAGIGITKIYTTTTDNIGIEISKTANVEQVYLKDFTLYGTPSNGGGICFGSAGYYCAYITLENIQINLFSKINAFGVSLNKCQEINFVNCKIDYNYDNILRPNIGYCTTTSFSGMNNHVGRAVRYGYNNTDLSSSANGIVKFEDTIFEENNSNAINSVDGSISKTWLIRAYFEGNNISAGTSTIYIGGSPSDYSQASLLLQDCEFHVSGNVSLPCLMLNYVLWRANNCLGLFNNIITTTSHTKGILIGNSIEGNAVSYQGVIDGLAGQHFAIENSIVDGMVAIGNIKFTNGLTISQLFGVGNGIQTPHIGIGGNAHATFPVNIVGTESAIQMEVTGGTTDKRKYDIRAVGSSGYEGIYIRAKNDAENTYNTLAYFTNDGRFAVGSSSPNANAVMDLTSTTKAFLPPRMTTTQKNAIVSAAGMIIYDTTLNKLCVYTTHWETITSV